jgi:dinuclear metal center YbgI/SA1388 family protein
MSTVKDIFEKLCELAPLDLQMSFDNAGFLFGRENTNVTKALLSLDVTADVIDEASALGAELIISHHPLIFNPIKSVTDEKLLRLGERKIAVISMHTNLDIAEGGVNDVLMAALGAKVSGGLDSDNCGRFGVLPEPMSMSEFLPYCKGVLSTNGLRYYDSGRPVYNLAVMGGSGGGSIHDAVEHGCDTYLTADIKYHEFLEAKELGINLIDGDHFCTENLVIPVLAEKLSATFNDVEFTVSGVHKQVISFA